MFKSYDSERNVIAIGTTENKIPAPIFNREAGTPCPWTPSPKIEEPSRCCRIQSWTPGDRRQIFRSRQGFQINKILVRAQCLVFLERYLAAFLNTW